MKRENENKLSELISLYGSLEAYEEEQRRCGLVSFEKAGRLNPFIRQIRVDKFWPSGLAEMKEEVENSPDRRAS